MKKVLRVCNKIHEWYYDIIILITECEYIKVFIIYAKVIELNRFLQNVLVILLWKLSKLLNRKRKFYLNLQSAVYNLSGHTITEITIHQVRTAFFKIAHCMIILRRHEEGSRSEQFWGRIQIKIYYIYELITVLF